MKVQPDVWAVQPEQLLELQSLFSSSARMGVIWLPNPSRILCFSFHITLLLLQQTTAERELKFVVAVSSFVSYFVAWNTGNLIMAVESNKVCRCCASFLDLGITTAALLLAEFKGKNASGYENFHLLMPSYSFKITEQLSFVVDT